VSCHVKDPQAFEIDHLVRHQIPHFNLTDATVCIGWRCANMMLR